MTTVLIVAQIFIVILLILLVLLQKSDSDAVSSLGGSGGGVVSHHTANNIITKTTMILGILFICNSIAIARTAYVEGGKASRIIQDIENNSSPIKPTDNLITEEKDTNNVEDHNISAETSKDPQTPMQHDEQKQDDSKTRAPKVE